MTTTRRGQLLGIGRFAELTGLSADALRHYHELGLLVPAVVETRTRYRRYDLDQIRTARLIGLLRAVDMPLAAIRTVLAAESERDRMRVLWSHRDLLVTRARLAAKLVDQLDDFMRRDLMSDARSEDLRSELIDMFDEHQAIAVALFEQTRGLRPDRFLFELPAEERPALYQDAARLAHTHATRLAEIVRELGAWPGISAVGDDGEAAAWGIAQHADDDNELCHEWLAPLERAVQVGDAPALHLALLTDRVLLRDGRPQRYGTILEPVGDTWRPRGPVEDRPALDDRRRRIGLDTFGAWASTLMPPDAWYADNSG